MRIMKNHYNLYLLLAFFLVYFGSNTLYTQIIFSTQLSSYFVFLLAVGVYLYNIHSNKKFSGNVVAVVSWLIILVFFSLIINWDFNNLNGYIIILLKMLGAFLLLKVLNFKQFTSAYSDVVLVLAVSSLIVTYIFPVFSFEKMFPTVTNSMGIRFYNCFLGFKIDSYGMFEIRNYGIFSEPAVYCFYLFLASVFSYSQDKISMSYCFRMCIYIMAMVTTFSPIGFITAATVYVLIVYKLFKKSSPGRNYFILIGTLIFMFVLLLLNSSFGDGVAFAFSKTTLEYGNGAQRWNCVKACVKDWMDSPVFGSGLKGMIKITESVGANTSTTGTCLAGFGVAFAILVTVLQFKSIMRVLIKERIVVLIAFYILFILQINNHGLIQGDWLWMFTMIGVVVSKSEALDNGMQCRRYQ